MQHALRQDQIALECTVGRLCSMMHPLPAVCIPVIVDLGACPSIMQGIIHRVLCPCRCQEEGEGEGPKNKGQGPSPQQVRAHVTLLRASLLLFLLRLHIARRWFPLSTDEHLGSSSTMMCV